MHIVLVGTKAQLIKMAPIIRELAIQQQPYLFVLTGQHTETMDAIIHAFELKAPDDTLVDIGESDSKSKLFTWLRKAWQAGKRRDYFAASHSILVHGDTMSTLLGALLGRYHRIPVVHIEAGLRSHNIFHPFPKELIRLIVSRLSTLNFCHGEWATDNLQFRSNKALNINTQLNTIIDSLRYALDRSPQITDEMTPYSVVSIHRYENLNNKARLSDILEQIILTSTKIKVIFVLHPVTRSTLMKTGFITRLQLPNIELSDRMDYVQFVQLLARSRFLITDGGSNQEEASYMGLPCLLVRKATERTEGIGDNVVLSNYDPVAWHKFVSEHQHTQWSLRDLPEIYPSREIAQALCQPGNLSINV